MAYQRFVVLFFVALLSSSVHARACVGVLSGGSVFTDVIINDVCVLRDIMITGSVVVGPGGSLRTMGSVSVSGTMSASGSGPVSLNGNVKVFGGFTASNVPATISIGSGADLGGVMLTNVNRLIARGKIGGLMVSGGGAVELRPGAKVLGGGISRMGGEASDIVICGATVTGGISMTRVTGSLIAEAGLGCPPSELSGAVMVLEGTGDVRISGNQMRAADVIVSNQVGNVKMTDTGLSDLALSSITGGVTLNRVNADSDGSVTLLKGPLSITNSIFSGDLILSNNQAVTLRGNSFSNEVVSVTGNSGPVVVVGNRDFSTSLTENTVVDFSRNNARSAFIAKNTGSVDINGNELGGIGCADNVAPMGVGNTYTPLAVRTGQCARI